MMSISSAAGKRLAKAKHQCDTLRDSGIPEARWVQARKELREAAEAVADELIAAGFHEMEGD